MNFYALNETPINGWATRQGSGQAAMSLAVSGKSANVVLGASTATMRMQAAGAGTRRVPASSDPVMVLQATGDGTRRVPAYGSGTMQMGASGEGRVALGIGGTATLLLTWPSGRGGILVRGDSTASMELGATADGRAAAGRHGDAHTMLYMRADAAGRTSTPLYGRARADIWINAYGGGRLVAKNSSHAAMALGISADGSVGRRVYGRGAITMRLDVARQETRQYRQINGEGAAALSLAFSARDYRVVTLPAIFYPAPKARGLRVNHENRGLRVARQDCTAELAGA